VATEADAKATADLKAATEKALEAHVKATAVNAKATADLEATSRLGSGGPSISDHSSGTAAGCGAQGTNPPDTQAQDGTGGTKRRLPTRDPTRCPTRVTDETIIGEKTDAPTTENTDDCATTPNDGATETTADNELSRGESPETDEERMERILNIPGIFQRIDEVWFGDYEGADHGPDKMDDVPWLYHR